LIDSNKVSAGNIKMVFSFNDSPVNQECVIGFISHKYPDPVEYIEGIKLVSTIFSRDMPNAKIQPAGIREKMNMLMTSQNASEVLYIHPEGYLTECSRSNIFFIGKDSLITAPDNDVLPGITRDYVIDIAHKLNLNLEFSRLLYKDLKGIDSVFISGTSPKVLPVKSIDSYGFTLANNIFDRIKNKYDNLIDQYILTHQKTR
jgi:branched-chain amino acid aminotransferase